MQLFRVTPTIAKGLKQIIIGGRGTQASLLLGRLSELGPSKEVVFDLEKQHVIAVVGKRGSGKTHTLGVFVEGLAAAGAGGVSQVSRGSSRHAVVIFDTLNLFQWIGTPLQDTSGPTVTTQLQLLRRWKIDSQPISADFLHPVGSDPAIGSSVPFSISVSELDAQDWARLLKVDLLGEPLGHLLGEVHRKSVHRQDRGAFSIEDMLTTLRTDQEIQTDYSAETIRALRQRLQAFGGSSLFDPSVADWSQYVRPGGVSVFLLGRVPEDLRSVLVFLIIRRILERRGADAEREKHARISGNAITTITVMPPTWVVIDEAQNVMPSSNSTAANDILARYVREGRNHGLSLAISTQQPTAIDAKVMAQVDTLIAHTLTVRTDLNYVLSNLKSAEPDALSAGNREITFPDSIRMLEPGQCVVSSTDNPRAIYVEVRPRQTLHGGFEV